MTERYNEEEFEGYVQQLVDVGRIADKEAGIAKLFLDKGYESLSDKQKFVFDNMIEQHSVNECQRCGVEIPWCEMLDAIYNGGYCNYCQHMKEKIMRE